MNAKGERKCHQLEGDTVIPADRKLIGRPREGYVTSERDCPEHGRREFEEVSGVATGARAVSQNDAVASCSRRRLVWQDERYGVSVRRPETK